MHRRSRVATTAATLATLFAAMPSPAPARPSGGAQRSPGAERLDAGSEVEAELKGGEAHRYPVELAAGTYFAVAIEQRGVDVRPAIVDPAGKAVYEYDFGEWGSEPAAIVAAVTGPHVLELRPQREGAPLGRYRLTVEALRPATEADERRARVMALQIEGFPLTRSQGPDDLRRARPLYEEALSGWRSLGDRFGEAHALTALGFIAGALDDNERSVELGRAEVAAWRELGHEYGEARALRNLAISLRLVGEWEESASLLAQSHALHRAAGRTGSESTLLKDLANSHRIIGDFGAALAHGYEAVTVARKLGDPVREAEALAAVGDIHLQLGELETAIDVSRRARALAPKVEVVQGDTAIQVGMALSRMGDLEGGQRSLEEALAIWERRNWRGYQANALTALGDIYARRGMLERARETFELAAARAAEAGFIVGEGAARRRIGDVLILLSRLDPAEAALEEAAALFERNPSPSARALVLASQARLALSRRDLAAARGRAEEALRLTESVRGRADGARIRAAMLASGQPVYEALVEVLMTQHDADPASEHAARALEISERARARSLLELVLGGRSEATSGEALPLDELRALQRRLNVKAQALDESRRRKNAATAASLSREVDEIAAALAVLEARIARENRALASMVNPEPMTVSAIQRDVLDDGTTLVEYLLAEPHSYAWVVSRDAVASHRLAPRPEIEDAARRLHEELSRVPRAAASSEAGLALAALLLEPLSLPAGRRLLVVASGMLQNVPFAALPVPGRPGERLLARHEIVHAPSASLVGAVRDAGGRRPAPRTLAVFADPVFEPDDPRVAGPRTARRSPAAAGAPAAPGALERTLRSGLADSDGTTLARLPFTRLEADTIASLAPRASVLKATGFAASLRAVTAPSLADYRIVHFATHGLLNTRTPELSGLVFSLVDETGRPQDGFLRFHDLSRLHLNAELVVLSGCETALGRAVEGEGVIGLTRGFIAAGASQVLASLWKVDDLATAELMRIFYRNLLQRGRPASDSLRAAQREMAASPRWRHPYFWAGLVIQGEWR